ncbi:MAG: sodium:solute symporter [Myxococcota bacterium]
MGELKEVLRAGLSPLDLMVVVGYFVAVLGVGFWAVRRKQQLPQESEAYLLDGRRLTLPMFVATLVSSWYGGILGVGEYSYQYGISQWVVFGVPYYLFAGVFAAFLAERVQQSTAVSIPDRLEQVYGPRAGKVGALLTFLMVSPAPYMLMVAILVQLLFGGSLVVCMLVGTLLSTLYLWRGGFRSVTATNYLEFAMMYAGFILILPFAYATYGGASFLEANLPPQHLSATGGKSLQYIMVWFFIALSTLVEPGFHQRCEAASSPGVARKGIWVSICFWFLFDALTVTTGLYARAALPELREPSLAYPMLAAKVLPPGLLGLFYVGLLATVMSTLVSNAFLAGQTLGRDLLGRIFGGDPIRFTRLGLGLALGLAGLLSWLKPSVVDLWYSVGSCLVPSMLLPLLLSYAPGLKPSGGVALGMMGVGAATALSWMVVGDLNRTGEGVQYPLGLEPLYPALLATALLWGGERLIRRFWEAQDNLAS